MEEQQSCEPVKSSRPFLQYGHCRTTKMLTPLKIKNANEKETAVQRVRIQE